jgi:acetyltransferase-like isoleucine patch superfamily enzyme
MKVYTKNQRELKMGRGTNFGICRFLYYPKIKVGNFTTVSSNVTFMGRCHHPSVLLPKLVSNYPFMEKEWGCYPACGSKGHTYIGNDVWVGDNVLIMDNVVIGNGAIVGAGTVVAKNVPAYAVMVGNPGKVAKYRFPDETITALNQIAWWNWPDEKIKSSLGDMLDIDLFVKKYL